MFEIERYKEICKSNKQIVTVFMTSGNREKYIHEAISSVLQQTYTNFCFIILDNNSKDRTPEIVKSFMKDDSRVFLIQRESTYDSPNVEYAFKICLTKYMAVFHDDDVLLPDYLDRMICEMESGSYWLICPQYNCINEKGEIINNRSTFKKRVFSGAEYLRVFWQDRERNYRLCYPANFYRTNKYKQFKNFFNVPAMGKAADQCIGFQTERYGGRIEIYPEVLFYYRKHKNQDSATAYGIMDLDLLKYLLNDDYYYEKLPFIVRNIDRRLIKIYKALIVNYTYNGNKKDIIECLDINTKKFHRFGIRTQIVLFFFKFSRRFIEITIEMASKIYGRRS